MVINTCLKIDHQEELADYILRICRQQDLSFRQIADRAGRKGYAITQSYISKIVSGGGQNLSVEKLQALAAGMNRPEEEVFAIARRQSFKDEQINDALIKAIAFGYPKLTKKDKEEIAVLLRIIDREIQDRIK